MSANASFSDSALPLIDDGIENGERKVRTRYTSSARSLRLG